MAENLYIPYAVNGKKNLLLSQYIFHHRQNSEIRMRGDEYEYKMSFLRKQNRINTGMPDYVLLLNLPKYANPTCNFI